MMSNLSEKDRRALMVGGIGVGLIVLLLAVIFPAMDAWESLTERRQNAEKQMLAIQNDANDAVTAVRTAGDLRKKATLHTNRLSLNQQTARMLQQVERLPGYNDLTVSRLEGLPIRQDEKFYRSSVSVQFSGSLQDLHRFLQAVEEASPALKVDRLALNTGQKDSARVAGQMVITGYAVVVGKGSNG